MSRLWCFLLVLVASPALAAPVKVQSTALVHVDDGTTGSASFTATPSQNSTITVTVAHGDYAESPPQPCGITPVTINGNTATGYVSQFSGPLRAEVWVYHLTQPQAGTVTVTVTCPSARWLSFRAHEWSGLLNGVVDQQASATGASNVAQVQTGTTQYGDGLAIGVLAYDLASTATVTETGGWTQQWEWESCTVHQCGQEVTKVLTQAGVVTHTWTLATPAIWAGLVVTLPASTASGGSPIPTLFQWTDNQGPGLGAETGFIIEKRTDQTAPNWVQIGSVGQNVTSFATTRLPTETSYCGRVYAYNAGGNSGYATSCLTGAPPPATCALPAPGTAITRPLLAPDVNNPRYFTDSNGCPIYLTGSHTWSNLQDGDGNTFDWAAYRALLLMNKHNVARLWMGTAHYGNMNTPAPGFNGATPWYTSKSPEIYGRSATPGAADGGNKFDLDTWNSTFWTRLNDRVHDLASDGVYALINVFGYYDTDNAFPGRDVWTYHPWNGTNNVNSVNGDTNGNGNGEEVWQLTSTNSGTVGNHTMVSATTQSSFVTPAITINAGSAVAACVNWYNNGVTFSSITLSGGGTFNQVGSEQIGAAGSAAQRMYLLENASSGSQTVTTTFSGNTDAVVAIVELRGVPTSGLLDQQAVQQDDVGSTYDTPQVTTTQASELAVVCSMAATGSGTFTHSSNTSFTVQEEQGAAASNWVVSLQTRILNAAGSYQGVTTYSGGTVNATIQRIATFRSNTSGEGPINARQRALLHKLCDEVCDEKNVLVDLIVEPHGGLDWAYDMIADWNTYCLTKTYCPPMGLSNVDSTFTDAQLQGHSGKWYGPSAVTYESSSDPYNSDPPATTGQRISISDSDHHFYMLGRDNPDFVRQWVWKTFLRGHHPILMEDLVNFQGWVSGRAAMGHTRVYADKMRLGVMTPQSGLSSTTYCLASVGTDYLVYQPSSGSFTLAVTAGTYNFEWFNPVVGLVAQSGQVTLTSGAQAFTPPFTGEAVLYLSTVVQPPPPPVEPPPPPGGLSISGTPTLLDEELL